MHYFNKKGEKVEVTLSRHALERFEDRYFQVFKERPKDSLADLEKRFNSASRVRNYNTKELSRLKRYGKDTMFFRNLYFTFVVRNRTVVTVEISRKDLRYLNKRKVK